MISRVKGVWRSGGMIFVLQRIRLWDSFYIKCRGYGGTGKC